jgi:ABC-type uncharacterized transport system permease subunit
MLDFLSRITISCFGLSYLIAWILEMARLYYPEKIRGAISFGFIAAGVFAQTSYLIVRARLDLTEGAPLASWQAWCLMVAWLLAVIVLYTAVRSPKFAYSVFMLPAILALVVTAYFLRDLPPFSTQGARSSWRTIHGLALLLGTVSVCVGFLTGLMYLLHASRLKRKKASRHGFKLPSLERLETASEQALIVSTLCLTVGFVSGILINLIGQQKEQLAVQWTNPVVWSSAVLLLWLLASVAFQRLYRPARHGRKVAYLVLANFLFLVVELAIVLSVSHGTGDLPGSSQDTPSSLIRRGEILG